MNTAVFVKPPCDCNDATYSTGMRMKNGFCGPTFFVEISCNSCGDKVSYNMANAEWCITQRVEKSFQAFAPKGS